MVMFFCCVRVEVQMTLLVSMLVPVEVKCQVSVLL